MDNLTFPLVDTHVHLWDPGLLTYKWLESLPTLNRRLSLPEFDEQCGDIEVGGMVFLQCDTPGHQGLQEAQWIQELAGTDPRLKAAVPYAPLEKGDSVKEDLQQLASLPVVKGVRRMLQWEEDGYGLQKCFIEGLRALAEFGFSFDICINHRQLGTTIEMVKQCPEIPFMLNHLATPNVKGGETNPWSQQIKELAELPNVSCKLSGLATEADRENWTIDDLRPFVDTAMEAFGVDRVAFGGDWPVCTLATSYPTWVETLYSLVESYSEDEIRKIFSSNGASFYKIS